MRKYDLTFQFLPREFYILFEDSHLCGSDVLLPDLSRYCIISLLSFGLFAWDHNIMLCCESDEGGGGKRMRKYDTTFQFLPRKLYFFEDSHLCGSDVFVRLLLRDLCM